MTIDPTQSALVLIEFQNDFDCMAATSEAEHDAAIAHDYPMFSKPMTASDFIAQLPG